MMYSNPRTIHPLLALLELISLLNRVNFFLPFAINLAPTIATSVGLPPVRFVGRDLLSQVGVQGTERDCWGLITVHWICCCSGLGFI